MSCRYAGLWAFWWFLWLGVTSVTPCRLVYRSVDRCLQTIDQYRTGLYIIYMLFKHASRQSAHYAVRRRAARCLSPRLGLRFALQRSAPSDDHSRNMRPGASAGARIHRVIHQPAQHAGTTTAAVLRQDLERERGVGGATGGPRCSQSVRASWVIGWPKQGAWVGGHGALSRPRVKSRSDGGPRCSQSWVMEQLGCASG